MFIGGLFLGRYTKKVKENTDVKLQFVKSSENITKIMVVAGSGKGMTEEIVAAGCDCIVTGESSYHDMLDLKELNRLIMIHCGIDEGNIDVADICTCCKSDAFFSHRVCGNERGNLALIVALK